MMKKIAEVIVIFCVVSIAEWLLCAGIGSFTELDWRYFDISKWSNSSRLYLSVTSLWVTGCISVERHIRRRKKAALV